MSRWRELTDQLSFEKRHPRAGRARLTVLRKLLRVVPDSIAFALFNFGSTFGEAAPLDEPSPRSPETIADLEIGESVDRGLRHSSSTVAGARFDAFELVDDPVFAMREIHRVCSAGAKVTLSLRGAWSDPLQKRLATPELLSPLHDQSSRARELGLEGLFRKVGSTDRALVLEATKRAPTEHPVRIDIGCGTAKREGYAGIDILPLKGVDIVRDVDRHGLPFSDDSIGRVHCSHFLEHVRDLVSVMNEIHRVCVDGGIVTIAVPTLIGPWAAADPTHVRLFNARSFGYFTGEAPEGYAGLRGTFDLHSQEVGTEVRVTLVVRKASGTPASGRV